MVDESKLSGVSSETKVQLVSGRALTIREIVNNKVKDSVYSLDYNTGKIIPRKIVDWYKGPILHDQNRWMHVTAKGYSKSNFTAGGFTVDYPIFTNFGTDDQTWKAISDLNSEKDRLVSSYEAVLNGSLGDFIWGMAVARDGFRRTGENVGRLHFKTYKGIDEYYFIRWLIQRRIGNLLSFKKIDKQDGDIYQTAPSFEMGKYANEIEQSDPFTVFFTKYLSNIGLAILYSLNGKLLDNGVAIIKIPYYKRYNLSFDYLADVFTKTTSIKAEPDELDKCIVLSKDSAYRFFDVICRYVPNMRKDQMFDRFGRFYRPYTLTNSVKYFEAPIDILEVRRASHKQMHNAHVFNIAVEGGNSFFAGAQKNGFLVKSWQK